MRATTFSIGLAMLSGSMHIQALCEAATSNTSVSKVELAFRDGKREALEMDPTPRHALAPSGRIGGVFVKGSPTIAVCLVDSR